MPAVNINGHSAREPLLADENRMSKDRRKFLIVCVFDFSLNTLLWLLSTKSLFDIVIVGFLRMSVLLCCYAWLRLDHWLPVALTTTITTIFITLKVLFFFNKDQANLLPQYLVILASFIVGWIELWLMPFRVLPRERRETLYTEATPTRVRVDRLNNLTTDDEFRSALEYSSDSDEEHNRHHNIYKDFESGQISREECLQLVESSYVKGQELLEVAQTWKLQNKTPEIRFSEQNNSYYVRVKLDCSSKVAFTAAWKEQHIWNTQIQKFQVVLYIDSSNDVIRSISAPAMRGYIASREFVDVRRLVHNQENDSYIGAFISLDLAHQSSSSLNGRIRGKNGINIIRITPCADSSESIYEWIMNTDLRGDIPKVIIRRAIGTYLTSYIKMLEAYINENRHKYQ